MKFAAAWRKPSEAARPANTSVNMLQQRTRVSFAVHHMAAPGFVPKSDEWFAERTEAQAEVSVHVGQSAPDDYS